MAGTTWPAGEHFDVVERIRPNPIPGLVDSFVDTLFLQAVKEQLCPRSRICDSCSAAGHGLYRRHRCGLATLIRRRSTSTAGISLQTAASNASSTSSWSRKTFMGAPHENTDLPRGQIQTTLLDTYTSNIKDPGLVGELPPQTIGNRSCDASEDLQHAPGLDLVLAHCSPTSRRPANTDERRMPPCAFMNCFPHSTDRAGLPEKEGFVKAHKTKMPHTR